MGTSANTVEYYNEETHYSPSTSYDKIIKVPYLSEHMNTDSIFYDIILGFIFAGIFTFAVALLGIFFNWCCVYTFCPKLHRRRLRIRKMRERRKWILREQLF